MPRAKVVVAVAAISAPLALFGGAAPTAVAALTPPVGVVDRQGSTLPPDWPGYERGAAHSSAAYQDLAITTTNAAALRARWTFTPAGPVKAGQVGGALDGSPTVVGGHVFIGARTGMFYALDAATGHVRWQKQLDTGSSTYCPSKGIVGTATVAPDPVTGTLTVYAPGANYLYALNAATGAQVWRRSIGPATADGAASYFNWSSPTVAGGRIFMGLAANCASRQIRGGEVSIDQHTGALEHTWYDVPAGLPGASVWSSAASDGTSVWVTTGNPDPTGAAVYDAYSIVRLDAATMTKQDEWTASIPLNADLDFGSSPTFFAGTAGSTTTDLVGACNKNGNYYAWHRDALSAGPVWQRQIGTASGTLTAECITSAAYDGPAQRLFVAANQTMLGTTSVPGAVRALSSRTGAVLWQKALDCSVVGTPTLNQRTQVLAVPQYGCASGVAASVELFNAGTGALLARLPAPGPVFAQPVFASGRIFVASEAGALIAYGP